VTYVDNAANITSKGLDEDSGFEINRPFYFRSRMPMKRVITMHGNNWIYLRRWTPAHAKHAQWRFDMKTKCIYNMNWKNYVMEIHTQGGHPYIRAVSGVNSRWW
jgi:hypothetical protein